MLLRTQREAEPTLVGVRQRMGVAALAICENIKHEVVVLSQNRTMADRDARDAALRAHVVELALHRGRDARGALVENREAWTMPKEARHSEALLLTHREHAAPVHVIVIGRIEAQRTGETLHQIPKLNRIKHFSHQRWCESGMLRRVDAVRVAELLTKRPCRVVRSLGQVKHRGVQPIASTSAWLGNNSSGRYFPQSSQAPKDRALPTPIAPCEEQVRSRGESKVEILHQQHTGGGVDIDRLECDPRIVVDKGGVVHLR